MWEGVAVKRFSCAVFALTFVLVTIQPLSAQVQGQWASTGTMQAAREFPMRSRERLTFEYVLLRGVNDAADNARELAGLVRGLQAKVNLIALNPGPGIDFETPEPARVEEFQRILVRAGIPTFVRRPRGRDIFAACGQLKRTMELSTIALLPGASST